MDITVLIYKTLNLTNNQETLNKGENYFSRKIGKERNKDRQGWRNKQALVMSENGDKLFEHMLGHYLTS